MSLFQNTNNDAALTSGPPTVLDVALNGFFVSQDGYTRCTSTGAIVNYSQGLPIDANGSVCVSQTNAIASYNNGLPFDSTGRLCIAGTAMQTVLNGLPMDNDGKLCSLTMSALSILATYGTDAHLWLPGVGVVNGITAGNFSDTAGTTEAVVDSTAGVGLVVDAGGGTINATQGTTANKPILRQSSGRYSWQFDGTDFLTLGSVPFQQADGQVVIAAAAASSYSAQRMVCAPSCSASTFAKNASVLFGTDGAPRARWTNNTPTDFTVTSPSAIPAGQAAVLTARKVGTTGSLRVNGAAQGTPITISGTITADSGGIGTERTSNPSGLFIGNIGPVIAIKGTVSDADLLTLEKWVGSLSGVTI